jgi:hypothetical protein
MLASQYSVAESQELDLNFKKRPPVGLPQWFVTITRQLDTPGLLIAIATYALPKQHAVRELYQKCTCNETKMRCCKPLATENFI